MCNAIAELIREGKDAGYSEGKNDGMNEERAANIQFLIRTCLDFNIPKEQIRKRIMAQYGLTASEARSYMDGSDR